MTTNINIRVDKKLKKDAENLFNELGITMSSAINMFLKTAIREEGIPFRVNKNKINDDTIKALDEYENMKDKKKYKRYSSFSELVKEVANA